MTNGTGFKGTWKALPDSVGQDSRLRPIHNQIYLVMAKRAQNHPRRDCWPDHDTIAADIGVTRRTVWDNLPLLIEKTGFIDIVGQLTLKEGGLGGYIYRVREYPRTADPKLTGAQKKAFHAEWKKELAARRADIKAVKRSRKLHNRPLNGTAVQNPGVQIGSTAVQKSSNGCETGVQILHTNRERDSLLENPESLGKGELRGGEHFASSGASGESAQQEKIELDMSCLDEPRPPAAPKSYQSVIQFPREAEFGAWLRRERTSRGILVHDLAAAFGLSDTDIIDMEERRQITPSPAMRKEMALWILRHPVLRRYA